MAMETIGVPHRMTLHLAKYGPGKDPAIDEPDDIIESDQWFEADGSPVHDERRIAELEQRSIAGQSGKE